MAADRSAATTASRDEIAPTDSRAFDAGARALRDTAGAARLDEGAMEQVLQIMRETIPPDWEAAPAPVVRGLHWPGGARRAVSRAAAEAGVEMVVVATQERGALALYFTLRSAQGEPGWIAISRSASGSSFADPADLQLSAETGRFPTRDRAASRTQRLLEALRAQLLQESDRAWLVAD